MIESVQVMEFARMHNVFAILGGWGVTVKEETKF